MSDPQDADVTLPPEPPGDGPRVSTGLPAEVPRPGPPADIGHEIGPETQARIRQVAYGTLLFMAGGLAGLWLAPDTPSAARAQMQKLQQAMVQKDARIGELMQLVRAPDVGSGQGKLSQADKARHAREGKMYVNTLKKTGAQGAAHLVEWFIGRWSAILDSPQPDDRTGRRAATLALLVGGMSANLNPGDYVPWQAEFLTNTWLAELHRDADGDGLPGPRSGPNTHDGFANVSVCHVAMALNQTMTDGQILMMPEMRCDRAESRMSVFLQGETFNDAMTEFVRAVREQGFLVVEREQGGTRLVLVGNKPPAKNDDE